MGRRSQRKGRRGEKELSDKLSAYGYSVTPGADALESVVADPAAQDAFTEAEESG